MTNFWNTLKKPIIGLAPMDGITDFPTRQIQCLISKPDVMYTEFISAEGFIRNSGRFEKTLFFDEAQRPIVCQIFGYTPQAFFETISRIAQKDFNGIDINMGCPAKSVLGKGGGGALISNNKLTAKIIESCLNAIKDSQKDIPLSVKTRIGENRNKTIKWFKFLSQFPLAEVTVHGRQLKQGNSGPVNWEEISKAAEILKNSQIICLGNGGMKSIGEAKNVCKIFELDGILIGQTALGNPWVFKEDYNPTKKEILETILKHAKHAEDFYETKRFVTVYKHFGWYPKGFKNCKQLKIELMKTKNYKEAKNVVDKFKQF